MALVLQKYLKFQGDLKKNKIFFARKTKNSKIFCKKGLICALNCDIMIDAEYRLSRVAEGLAL